MYKQKKDISEKIDLLTLYSEQLEDPSMNMQKDNDDAVWGSIYEEAISSALQNFNLSGNLESLDDQNINIQQDNEKIKNVEEKSATGSTELFNSEQEIEKIRKQYEKYHKKLNEQYSHIHNILMIDSLRKNIIEDFFKTTDELVEKLDDKDFKDWYKKCKEEFKHKQEQHDALEKQY